MIIAFILFPIAAFLLAHIYPYWRHSRLAMWVYCCLYAVCLPITDEYTGDAVRYVSHFIDHINNGYSFTERLLNLYADTSNTELLPGLIYATIGNFTNNHLFLLAAFGLIFGYFYSGNVVYLGRLGGNRRVNAHLSLICVLTASMLMPVWYVNGFRFWAASLIFIYSSLPILINRKYSRVPFLLVAGLLHSSFIFFSFVLLFLFSSKKLTSLLAVAMMVSLILKHAIPLDFLSKYLGMLLPNVFYDKYHEYLEAGAMEREGGRIIGVLNQFINVVIQGAVFIIWMKMKRRIEREGEVLRLLSVVVSVYFLVNIFSGIPSLARFYTLAYYLSFVFMYLILTRCRPGASVQYAILLTAFVGILGIAADFITVGAKITGIAAVFFPVPLIPQFYEYNISLEVSVGYFKYVIYGLLGYLAALKLSEVYRFGWLRG